MSMSETEFPPILVTQTELAARLELTTRWVYDLTADGIFQKVGETRKYDLDASHKAYAAYKLGKETEKRAPSATDSLTQRKEDMLKQRLAREARGLITMEEAMEAFDLVTGAFIEVLSGLPARITRNIGERKRIEAIIDGIRERLSGRFGAEREALRTGVPVGEANPEDDA